MKYNGLVDIGVNLTHRRFDEDRAAAIERAAAAGVTSMILTGVSLEESRAAVAMAAEHPDAMRATVGVHPHHADEWSEDSVPLLEALSEAPAAAAIGETGLDYFRDFSPRPVQRHAFAAQLELAARLGCPAFLHQRDAEADFLAIMKEYRPHVPAAVLHCFTGDQALLEGCLELDLHIGVTGWVTDQRRGGALRECLPNIPDGRLMIETDAPFLLPRGLPAKPANRRNEPAFLPHVLEAVARLRGGDPDALGRMTASTSRKFFGLPQ
ncbi:TatD family hydrolase [Spiribacter insolitus]|uniref:TatD family hydrolase n=1 Tax=Spiribacter insolitus TaxID=3122417 RepID=A0ABV3T5Q3_9GAMM